MGHKFRTGTDRDGLIRADLHPKPNFGDKVKAVWRLVGECDVAPGLHPDPTPLTPNMHTPDTWPGMMSITPSPQ